MAFPNLYDSKAIGEVDKIFNKPKQVEPRKAVIVNAKFWTPQLIRKFLARRYGGQDHLYDDYFQQGITEQKEIMARIKANRSAAIKLRFKAKPGDTRIMDLMA